MEFKSIEELLATKWTRFENKEMIVFYITYWYGDWDEIDDTIALDINNPEKNKMILSIANFLEKYKDVNLEYQERLWQRVDFTDEEDKIYNYMEIPTDPQSDYEGDCSIISYYVRKEII